MELCVAGVVHGKLFWCNLETFQLAKSGYLLTYPKKIQQGIVKRETRFASKLPPSGILSKIEQAATPLGFNVEKRNYKVCLFSLFFLKNNYKVFISLSCARLNLLKHYVVCLGLTYSSSKVLSFNYLSLFPRL